MPDANGAAVPSPERAAPGGDRGQGPAHGGQIPDEARADSAGPGAGRPSVWRRPRSSNGWSNAWLGVMLIAAVAATLLVANDSTSPVRPVVTLFFALTCPGMALIRLLRLEDPLAELVLAVATSIAVAGLLGGFLLYYGLWAPEAGLFILVVITLTAVAAERVMIRLSEPPEPQPTGPFEQVAPAAPDAEAQSPEPHPRAPSPTAPDRGSDAAPEAPRRRKRPSAPSAQEGATEADSKTAAKPRQPRRKRARGD